MPTSELKKRIRNVPDFPRKGIQFKDITTGSRCETVRFRRPAAALVRETGLDR